MTDGWPRAGRRRATRLVDIAEAAGVHVSTVSRVLNGDPALSIRPETYERIMSTASEQGYRPNALARALERRQTGAFALVVPLLRNPIWARLQRGALQRARARLRRGGPQEVDTVHRRFSTGRRLCAARGISLSVRHAAATEEGGWDAGMRMLRREPRPTACGVGSINQLFGLLAALRASRVAVPGEMSVVSFDEDECLAFLEMPVTGVCMPLAELGTAAVDALIARIEGEPAADVLVAEPMSLQLRDSVSPPPGSRPRGDVPTQRAPG